MAPEDQRSPLEAAPPQGAAPHAWLGIIAVALGVLVMVAGMGALYVYAKRHPGIAGSTSAAGTAPLPAPLVPPPPVLPAPSASPPETTEPDDRIAGVVAAAGVPFAEDAGALVPVERRQALWGTRDAPVTITVFGDLECEYTIAELRVLFAEKVKRGDDVRLAFRHFPLSQHREGARAARVLSAVHATRGESGFWAALRDIIRRGRPLESGVLEGVLGDQLPGDAVGSGPPGAEAAVAADEVLGASLFVRATPALFVNGRRFDGFHSRAVLAEAIDRELEAAYLALANGVTPGALYTTRTRKNLVNLGSDPEPRVCVPAGDSPARGAATPLVTIIGFSEFECELCRQGEAALGAALRAHPRELRAVWKNYPLPQHQRARRAAGLALEARRLGGDRAFWAVADALLEPRAAPDDAGLARAAARAELDVPGLLAAARAGANAERIDADVRLADKLGLTGAPTYFVNGRKVSGALPPAELELIVREEIALARRVSALGSGSVADLACGVRKRGN